MRFVAIILAAAAAGSGCGFIAARGPGPARADQRPVCNAGKGAVFADGLAASLLGILALAAGGDAAGTATVAGLSSVVFVTSAVTGSRSADRCRAAIGQYDDLLAARERAEERGRLSERAADRDDADGDAPTSAVEPAPVPPTGAAVAPAAPSRPPPDAVPGAGVSRLPVAAPAPAAVGGDATSDADPDADGEAAPGPSDWRQFWREVIR